MKTKFFWPLLSIPLLFVGCGDAKLETENANLKTEINDLQQQVQKSESTNSDLKIGIEKNKQQIQALENQIAESKKQAEQKKSRDRCFENIQLLLNSFIGQVKGENFVGHSQAERQSERNRLKEFLATTKEKVAKSVSGLEENGAKSADIQILRTAVDDFVSKFDFGIDKISMAFDYLAAGNSEGAKETMNEFAETKTALNKDIFVIGELRDKE